MIALLAGLSTVHAVEPAPPRLSAGIVHAGAAVGALGALSLTTGLLTVGDPTAVGLMVGGAGGLLVGGVATAAPFLRRHPAVALPAGVGLVALATTVVVMERTYGLDDFTVLFVGGLGAGAAMATQLVVSECSIGKLQPAPLALRDGGGVQIVGRF